MDRQAFIKGGNATFTVTSIKTGTRFTYKVKAKDIADPSTIFFVSVLTGSNNESDFSYLGILTQDGTFRRTANSRVSEDAPSSRAFAWFIRHVDSDAVEFHHAGRCARCARKLTVPESVETGFGPECAQKREAA